LNLGARHITISTCGLIDKIDEFTAMDLQVNLAISLHAPDDALRKELMPIARKYALPDLIAACRRYTETTHRRITFEYSCVEGENTSPEDAAMLADLVSGMNCHINLIPVNQVPERAYRRPARQVTEAFRRKLEKRGISVTIRREMGRDINGACGQLRRSYLQ
jgi:23S rRNA (adenine2503-C2)-methyltransferase